MPELLLMVLAFAPTIVALIPWSEPVRGAVLCRQCRYPREGLGAGSPCPECGASDSEVAYQWASWRPYHAQLARLACIIVILVAFVVLMEGFLLRFAIAYLYTLDGFTFQTGWRASVNRELRGDWHVHRLAPFVLPLPLLALHPKFKRALAALLVILALAAVVILASAPTNMIP